MAAVSDTHEGTIIEVLCAYAQNDEPLQQILKTHLSNVQHQGRPLLLHDRPLLPGMDRAQEIDQHINSAQIILLLVSADFLATRYSYGSEMARAWERHAASEVRIIPIILRPVDWHNEPFARVQVLPHSAKPITKWSNQEEAIADVVAAIRQLLRMLESPPPKSSPRPHSPEQHYGVNASPTHNSLFAVYEKQLARIFAQLLLNQCVAISGPGDSDKTELAVAYAYLQRHVYSTILWVQANTLDTLNNSYRELAIRLNLREKDAGEQELVVLAVKTWLETRQNWLLVIDNLNDPSMLFPTDKESQPLQSSAFLPAMPITHPLITMPANHLLITTQATSLNLGLARPISIINL